MSPWQFEEVSPSAATALQTRFTHHRMCSVDYYHHLY
ncbi:hypothetical protein ALO68_102285 [Pseudomonas syringae pv. helianthi]|uniref:Uncharacterized protein n=3 Tax=Pseudomonas syringae group TaxID=136849 RepID=A0A0P9S4Y5_9PSED|nr:hypothetical protein ALO68_102285 [Pseudomonas syringae pv. helianthi]KPY80567.1 hypothetical protein ALO44_102171 [Pseudomonas syringae pv. tagetis]RML47447.1 hypothetical protein ALQ95_04844 [Pseudomonas syringae pv. ribicola]RMR10270.1 hypothetical protein ALP93_101728 [Pseudomonas syringae pv. helianthi]RMW12226.1 hypothetical protein ALO98_101794 [Pseudomonas syringae pv. tagetis]